MRAEHPDSKQPESPAVERPGRVGPLVTRLLVVGALLLWIGSCAKAKPKLFDRDRAMSAAPIAKQHRSELIDGSLLDGLNKLRTGDLDAAKAAFIDHLKDHPKSALSHYHLGLVAMDQERFDPARTHFEKALRLQPQMYGAMANLGVLYLDNGEEAAALRRLEEAESVAPNDARVLVNLGNAQLRRGLWSEANESYAEASKIVSGHASLMYNQAVALCARHRYDKALKLLDEAVMHRPGFQLGRALRIVCLQGLGRVKEAVAEARKNLLELDASSDLELVLGRALLADGKIDKGIEALRRAVKLDGTDPNALLGLGEALDATGRKVEAIQMYERFLKVKLRAFEDSRRVRKRLRSLRKN